VSPKECVFCGRRGKLTKEHLWSDWIRRNLLVNGEEPTAHTRASGGTPYQGWKQPPFTAVVRAVCGDCNSTWMNDIENEVQPHLTPLIQGRQRILGTQAQRALATWVFLKVLMFDRWRDAPPLVPREHYEALYCEREPPAQTQIAVSAYMGGTSLARYHDAPLDLTDPRAGRSAAGAEAYLLTLTIHHAVFQVFGHVLRRDLDLIREPELARVTTPIWPIGLPVVWPPNRTMLNHPMLLELEQASGTARPRDR
jgi:hypothetical protein